MKVTKRLTIVYLLPGTKMREDRKCEKNDEPDSLPSWRRKFTEIQTKKLEEIFLRQKYITGKERAEIAKKLGLSTKQVKTWFQNRRTKWKREKQRNSGEFVRQEGLYVLTEDYKRSVDDYVQCCELRNSVDNWGYFLMSNSYPIHVNEQRRISGARPAV